MNLIVFNNFNLKKALASIGGLVSLILSSYGIFVAAAFPKLFLINISIYCLVLKFQVTLYLFFDFFFFSVWISSFIFRNLEKVKRIFINFLKIAVAL